VTNTVKLMAPDGTDVVGTLEVVPGTAQVSGVRLVDGRLDIDHGGETELDWEDQDTVEVDGELIFVDADGSYWKASQLIPEGTELKPGAKAVEAYSTFQGIRGLARREALDEAIRLLELHGQVEACGHLVQMMEDGRKNRGQG